MRPIDADDLRKVVKNWYFDKDIQKVRNDPAVVDALIDLFIRTIKNQPTIKSNSVSHGYWNINDVLYPVCSECGEVSDYECDGTHKRSLYCPNCGAKMSNIERSDTYINTENNYDLTNFKVPFGEFANYENGCFRINYKGRSIFYESEISTIIPDADTWCHYHCCDMIKNCSINNQFNKFNLCSDAVNDINNFLHDFSHDWCNHQDFVVKWFNKYRNTEWYKLAELSFNSLIYTIASLPFVMSD